MDFNKGETEVLLTSSENLLPLVNPVFLHLQGYVRFDEEGGAKKALEEMEKSKNQLCGAEVQLRVLEGKEEESYWSKLAASQGHGRKKKQVGRGSHKRGPKRGLKNGEKDAPSKKMAKSDDDS